MRNSEMRSLRVHESRRSDDSMSDMTKVALKSSGVLTFLFLPRRGEKDRGRLAAYLIKSGETRNVFLIYALFA